MTTLKLADLLARGDAALAPTGLLLAQKLVLLDCSEVEALSAAQLDALFGALPADWSFAELGEVIDVTNLSESLAEQLVAWVDQRGSALPAEPVTPEATAAPAETATPAMRQPLHPIVALERVVAEYSSYLRTEFRARDPQLKEALERALDEPRFLAQDAFFQAHRPFRSGLRWSELPLDPRLARAMQQRARSETAFLHQSEAIRSLLSPEPASVVVTTGTGSGKTESFLLPVLQNAIDDAAAFRRSGLTAVLIYPMNALANDQELRIRELLQDSGFDGTISVAKYDRSTREAERQALREQPPHILLTNYVMLEYLLVRPADRDAIFANHRCRFLVLDEVHTYRGTLGANIALLVRRLRAHLAGARQDWFANVPTDLQARRFPQLLPVGTSATIKSVADEDLDAETRKRLRDEAVQEFFGKLSGANPTGIRVLGEELQSIPAVRYQVSGDFRSGLELTCDIDGEPQARRLQIAAETLRPLLPHIQPQALNAGGSNLRPETWNLIPELNRLLIGRPYSVAQIAGQLQSGADPVEQATLRARIEAALVFGAALPDTTPGVLRLRAHRFIRGGWQFHRCVNPDCGRLYPMGEERCSCGYATAPLYLCRSCGAHYLRFVGDDPSDPTGEPLRPSALRSDEHEWMLYDPSRFELQAGNDEDDGDDAAAGVTRGRNRRSSNQMRRRPIHEGSFDPQSLYFSSDPNDYSQRVTLAPARTRCLCCGATLGNRSVLTPVALGTSAAVKVMAEGMVEALAAVHAGQPGHDGKERLLVFSDSRQDAAHQARFIHFAGRYDRMRRRVMQIVQEQGQVSIEELVRLLGERAIQQRDNPHLPRGVFPSEEETQRLRAWEEAPLLDEIALNAGYRATLVNLGLLQVAYDRLDQYVTEYGASLAGELGLVQQQLEHLCRCLLDEIRVRGCLSRLMLRYHPRHPACPAYVQAAEWERRVKQPAGYALDSSGMPVPYLESAEVPPGIRLNNPWRRSRTGGRSPSIQRICEHLLRAYGAVEPAESHIVALFRFLLDGSFLIDAELFGARERGKLLQVNAETLRLRPTSAANRMRCAVCALPMAGAQPGAPCPRCHGRLAAWPEAELQANRSVQRIRAGDIVPLFAREHTAQVPGDMRHDIEEDFKASAGVSPVNLLACSPTLEMGIDVGGLDAVVLRNIPPRPDNYAQRGGRAGRRSRVGLVLGYARSRPHDQYFYDRPDEMIAGEIPAPALALGNRDVLLRHLCAMAIGSAEPGLSGRMADYVSVRGEIDEARVEAFIAAVVAQTEPAIELARAAWGEDILPQARLSEADLRAHLAGLPEQIRNVFRRTARQVIEIGQSVQNFAADFHGGRVAVQAADMVRRLLGIRSEQQRDADDRSSGYPLRRFAEFGILPGYEFPSEPATLRLLGDQREEDPISVARVFGIAQFQPEANVFARGKRWRVIGLDSASPWNPLTDEPDWFYRICRSCNLHYDAAEPSCPRCASSEPGPSYPAAAFAGFLASRDESPILDEEDRYALSNRVVSYPQWNGSTSGRWQTAPGWSLRLSSNEEVRWLNEGPAPGTAEIEARQILHEHAGGYRLCPSCGRKLNLPPAENNRSGGRRTSRRANEQDIFGHGENCPQRGQAPRPQAIVARGQAEILRLLIPLPEANENINSHGLSLGYALLQGMRRRYTLDGPEIVFELEGPWQVRSAGRDYQQIALSFIDPSLGGSGYMQRIAGEMHLVARSALDHLDHSGCETACYRCLKSYANQRYHDQLNWPQIIGDLELLAETAPAALAPEQQDGDDPGPWLEAYAAGVGSPLELRFLRLFEQYGFQPQKQVPIALDSDQAITVADFAVPAQRLAIYIDGAAFHRGRALRRDRLIRDRLRQANPAWQVIELRAADLQAGAALIKHLKELTS